MALKTNYKDFVSENNERKYRIVPIGDTGLSEIKDATTYLQEGDRFGASDLNATNAQVNALRTDIDNDTDLPVASDDTLGQVYYIKNSNKFVFTQQIKNGGYRFKTINYVIGFEENVLDTGYFYAKNTGNWYYNRTPIEPIYDINTPVAAESSLNKLYVTSAKPFVKYGSSITDVTQRCIGNGVSGSYTENYGYVCISGTTGPIFDFDISTLLNLGLNKIIVKLTIPSGVAFIANKTISLCKNQSYQSDDTIQIKTDTILQSKQIYEFDIDSGDFNVGDILAITFDHPNAVISDIWFESNNPLSLSICDYNYDFVWSRLWNTLYVKTLSNLTTQYPPSEKYINLIVIVEENNQIYKCNLNKDGITYEWGNIGSSDNTGIEYLSLSEYNALTPAQQTDGTVYNIYDDITTPDEGSDVVNENELNAAIKNNNDAVTIVTIPIDNWVAETVGTKTYYTREIEVTGMYSTFTGAKDTNYVRVYTTDGKLDIDATNTVKDMFFDIEDIQSMTNAIKVYSNNIPTTSFQIYLYGLLNNN